MSRLLLLRYAVASSAMAALMASAQPAPAAPAAPASAQAQAAGERSTLQGYRPFAEEKILPWKQANDTVGNIGGWRAYAKEAQEGAAPASETPPGREPAGPGKH